MVGIATEHCLIRPVLSSHFHRVGGWIDAVVQWMPEKRVGDQAVSAAQIEYRGSQQSHERLDAEKLMCPEQGEEMKRVICFQQQSQVIPSWARFTTHVCVLQPRGTAACRG